MTDSIVVEIDGQQLSAQPNQTVIQVADEANIYIPRFCYHPQLSIAANCRMCLVEVVNSPRLMPACALPVTPGLKILTKSAKTQAAQRTVMEFLLINHPLDCPICDQGGECELQDLSLSYGKKHGNFQENKRAVVSPDIGPLIATEMTRCIQCTRCVRFGDEIAGLRELGAIKRGEDMAITTYIKHALHSELSGNIIDVCPVGALTAKPSRATARAWELRQVPSISPHDAVGANLNIHVYDNKVTRVVARKNDAVNEMWLSDRDRFSYAGLYHAERLTKPLLKINGSWQHASWQECLTKVVNDLSSIVTLSGGDQLGALASPSATVEEFYLLQKLMRALGSSNLDHRLRQTDFRDQAEMPLTPTLGDDFAALAAADSILLVASNIQQEQPLLATRIRYAALRGGAVFSINMLAYKFSFKQQEICLVKPDELIPALAGVAKACIALCANLTIPAKLAELLNNILPSQAEQKIASGLLKAQTGFVLLGNLAFNHPEAATIRRLTRFIADVTKTKLGLLPEGGNVAGAWLAGMVPHRRFGGKINNYVGLNAISMLEKKRRAYLLLQVEPDLDCARPWLADAALQNASVVVALTSFASPYLLEVADILLPIAPFTENIGTCINVTGKWQSFTPAVALLDETQQAWDILVQLGKLLNLPDFAYESYQDVYSEIVANAQNTEYRVPVTMWKDVAFKEPLQNDFMRIGEVPLYAIDSLVRRSLPLQETQKNIFTTVAAVRLPPDSGFKNGELVVVSQRNTQITLPVVIDQRLPSKAAWLAGGIKETANLGDLFESIEILKLS